ncbi:hypothetical protein ACV356_29350 [Pseudomonas aeruginosa]
MMNGHDLRLLIANASKWTILYKNTVIITMPTPLPPELYYLSNFRTALAWVGGRYADLLTTEELAFISNFEAAEWRAQVRISEHRDRPFR